MRRRGPVIATLLAVGAFLIAGCIPPPPKPPAPLAPMPIGITHTVAVTSATFTDTTRPTAALDGYPGSPVRELPTTIWYPANGGGPFPLVVFAHGFDVTPPFYSGLLSQIAAAGYVVAAPTYPLLSGQPAGPTDTVDWGQLFPDTWFVTSRVLDLSSSGSGPLGGLIDPNRIAVAGHSDGADLAFGDGYQPFRLDWRVRAVVAFASDLGSLGSYQPNGRPILHVLSDDDVYNPYGDAIAWDRSTLQEPKHVLSLWNASHASPFTDANDPHLALVLKVTIAFLDSTLKAHPEAMTAASAYVTAHASLASLE
jgi:dienelactone hydrolase